ncbi:MAG: DUF401 family protein [Candidatus Adiutrix sp.]|jgi:integral membrane protein (TIGR00529 family)|nr:DUF401 family protein [Candidatus Adiutrix sp.]
MPFSESASAFGKFILTFGGMLFFLYFKLPLWLAILAGCLILAALTSLPLGRLILIPPRTAVDADFIALLLMIFGILVLSGVQGASGQGRRQVRYMERIIPWPRVRLVIFPAMVGLLPMPGGALFSCPMLEEAAQGLNLDPRRKVLINYWFRHIWEVSWPLYPGYVLASSLLGLDLLTLLQYTFPMVFTSFGLGWFFLMRDLAPPPDAGRPGPAEARAALISFLYESLPLLVTLVGAVVFSLLISRFAPGVPSQAAFIFSVALGIALALFQGRGRMEAPLFKIAFNTGNFRLVLLVYAIFIFQDVIEASGLVSKIGAQGESGLLLLFLVTALPFFSGLLTGIMVGFVGVCFPLIIGVILKSGLEGHMAPLIVMALVAGNVGMLLSPLHVCLVVTLEYFKSAYLDVWRTLFRPLAALTAAGAVWAVILHLLGAHF